MTAGRVCPTCGPTYHGLARPPRGAETCDLDGARLERRPDDTPEVVEVRQQIYDEYAVPILEHYRQHAPDKYVRIDGEQPLEGVYRDTCRTLGLTPAG